jgi:hypothetical protein
MAKKYTLDGATKAFNVFLKSLIGLGIPAGNTVVLTVPGRRTGQPRSTPITLQVEGARRYAMAPYGEVAWVQNARAAGGRARIEISRSGRNGPTSGGTASRGGTVAEEVHGVI